MICLFRPTSVSVSVSVSASIFVARNDLPYSLSLPIIPPYLHVFASISFSAFVFVAPKNLPLSFSMPIICFCLCLSQLFQSASIAVFLYPQLSLTFSVSLSLIRRSALFIDPSLFLFYLFSKQRKLIPLFQCSTVQTMEILVRDCHGFGSTFIWVRKGFCSVERSTEGEACGQHAVQKDRRITPTLSIII